MRTLLAIAIVAAFGCNRETNPDRTIARAGASLLPTLQRPRPIDLPVGQLGHPDQGLVLPINVDPLKTLNAKRTSLIGTPERYTWRGGLGDHGAVAISRNGEAVIGTIIDGTRIHRIESTPGGGLAIRTIQHSNHEPADSTQAHGPQLQLATEQGNIRVLAAYTEAARRDCADIKTVIDQAIALTNLVAENSGVSTRFDLADDYMTDYDESQEELSAVVNAFASATDSKMNEVHQRRRAAFADIAVLFVSMPDTTFFGISAQTMADFSTAFSVVNCQSVNDYFVLAHEIGHLFGLNDDGDVPSPNTLTYGYGFFNDSSNPDDCWRTVMSRADGCQCGCPLIPYWSNPAIRYHGILTGDQLKSDDARVIRNSAGAISRFEPPLPQNLR